MNILNILNWSQEEAKALVDHLVSSRKEETLVKEQFNIPVVNVIWKMVASKTFPLKSEEGMTTFYSKHVHRFI